MTKERKEATEEEDNGSRRGEREKEKETRRDERLAQLTKVETPEQLEEEYSVVPRGRRG